MEAAFWLGISRLVVLVLPFRWIAPFLGQQMQNSKDKPVHDNLSAGIKAAQAIQSMSRHLPWECKCLVQAISGKMMLKRRGIGSSLYLGVAKAEGCGLAAHAWLSSGGRILLGRQGMHQYTVVAMFR